MATIHRLCVKKPGIVLMHTEAGEPTVKEIRKMPLLQVQLHSDIELCSTVVTPLKSLACVEEGSGEKRK